MWLAGPRAKSEDYFFFRKNGTGVRGLEKGSFVLFKWSIEDDGAVRIVGAGKDKWLRLLTASSGEFSHEVKDSNKTQSITVPDKGDPEKGN